MQMLLFLLCFYLGLSGNPQLPQHTLPVYGNASLGYYFVKIYVGHPPQQQSVIIDTGSGQLALPCNKCTDCNPNHINQPFDMRKSKTAEYLTCQSNQAQCRRCSNKSPTQSCRFTISYAEGSSLQGVIIKDSIQFESFSQGQQITSTFGCTTRQTNLFLKQQANGIFGLSPERTSTLLQDLYKKHHGFSGLCLTGNGGLMTIGKVNKDLHLSQKSIRTSFSTHRNLFSLDNVGQIKIGNSIVHHPEEKFGSFGIFIDSGSTFTYFPHQNYLIFKNQLLQSCSQKKQVCQQAQGQSTPCFHLKGLNDLLEDIAMIFPPLIIKIGDGQISWKPEKYFLLRDVTNRQICLAVQSLDRYLLGANWMVDKDIVFNLKDNTVEIFSEANCLGKQGQRRYMSQYSEQADGHEPLKYQSGVIGIVKHSDAIIIVGIVLIIIGSAGVLILILNHCDKNKLKKHKPVSPVETQDQMELSSTSSSQQSFNNRI